MPRQNRVDPLGNLIATKARGTLMGNRGILHNGQQQIKRFAVGQRWIFCQLQFKGRHQEIMAPGRYTQLFFLDEATALSAGHRPCAECLRQRFNTFRDFWAKTNPGVSGKPAATDMDAILHGERLGRDRKKITFAEQFSRLPTGTMILPAGQMQPFLVHRQQVLPWHPEGYGEARDFSAEADVEVLTPRSVVRMLAQEYPVEIHPSASGGVASHDRAT